MTKKILALALLWLAHGTAVLAQQTSPPAAPPSAPTPQATAEDPGYVGATTRVGLGYDETTHLRGEIYRVLTESETSSVLGEGWIGRNAGGIKFSYNWLPEAWSAKSADPIVRKFFLAADRNTEGDAKVTVGGGFEKQNLFGGLYGSFGVTGRRQISDATVATTETIQGDDGRPFLQDITTSVRTQVFERAYDYGIGARIGHFYEPTLLRLTLGADYEWGRGSARQTTISLGLEKYFAGAPFSLALNVEHFRKSGGFDLSGTDTRLMGMLRYEFGGPVFRPARESRMVQVAPKETSVPVAAPEPPKPVTAPPAPPSPAATLAPPRKETRLVKTTATMLSDAFFEFDKSTLTPAARSALDGVIARIKTSGFTGNIRITGHTCDIGSAAYNQGLSERRANSVRNYLVTNGGLSRDVIIAEGMGLRNPRYPNTRAERYKNRRVDLEFVTYEDKVEEYLVPSPPVVAPPPAPAPVAAAVTPPPLAPAPVEWRREVLDKEPPWLRRALRQSLPHKQTVDVYRQQEQATTIAQGEKRYINRPPVAANDVFSVQFGSVSNSLDVLANDSDPDGDVLSLTTVTAPQHGSATVSGNRVIYTPASGYSGGDSFSYSISDGKGGSASAIVTITVQGPPNRPPAAANDTYTVDQNSSPTALNVLANDSDPDGDTLTISSVGTPAHGTAMISGNRINYAPAAGYAGADSFTYSIADGRGGTASATVSIAVQAVVLNRPPIAQNDSFTVNQDSTANSLNVLANDSDPDGDTLTISTVTAPAHGTAVIAGNRVNYAPTPGYTGSDAFTYTISDGKGGSASATVAIAVAPAAPANRAPVARDDTYFVSQKFTDLDVLANDSDPDSDPLVIIAVTQPLNGTVQIAADGRSIRFTMAFAFNNATFTYTISDGRGGTSTATVRLIDP
jgi:outer membrane protein OmpA-like peptidoglycan-associated protein